MWTRANPAEELPNPREIVWLQKHPKGRWAWVFTTWEPAPIPAARCAQCKLVIADYSEAAE